MINAGVAQRLEYLPSKQKMRVQFPSPAPKEVRCFLLILFHVKVGYGYFY